MAIQWCTLENIESMYHMGLTSVPGSIDGLTLILTINSVSKTLSFAALGNAQDQATFIATCNSFFTGVTFTVDYFNCLKMSPGTNTLVVGAGTANSLLGFSPGGAYLGLNALTIQMFGYVGGDPEFSSSAKLQAIAVAGSIVESRLRTRYTMPSSLSYIPPDLMICAAKIAGYLLQIYRGFAPSSAAGIDNIYKVDYEWALNELHEYSHNRIHPDLVLTEKAIPSFSYETTGTMLGTCGFGSGVSSSDRGYR
jgi:hypothetical protein